MSVTFDQIENAFGRMQEAYNNRIPVELRYEYKPKDLYGEQITERDNETYLGAYYPSRGEIVLFSANLRDEAELTRTIAHEIGGHWSLNTLEPVEKRHLLDSIVTNRKEPSLAPAWHIVDRDYPDLPPLYKAEEVFAFIAEERFFHKNRSQESHLYLSPLNSNLTINLESLGEIADKIYNGVRYGTREQQIFPRDDQSQFRKELVMADQEELNFESKPEAVIQPEPLPEPKPVLTLDNKAKERLQEMRSEDAQSVSADTPREPTFNVDASFVKDLESRMAKSQFNELGWRDRNDIDDVMRDVEILARYNLPVADKLWTKYNPDDKDKPVFIDGDDIDKKTAGPAPQVQENVLDTDRPEDTKKEFLTPETIMKKYLQAGNKYHFRDTANAVAFEDKGHRIATEHENPEIVKSMVELATAKGWQSIQVKGSDDFKREAWLQASLSGLEVQGYKPKQVDLARLADIQSELPGKSYARNSIINSDDREVKKTESLKTVDEVPPTQDLSPQQDTAIKALQSIMRNRGDKEETISMATEMAKERFTTNRVYVGKVIERGFDHYNNDSKSEKSPYVTLQTESGDKKVWGVDLPRALDDGKVGIGDEIALAYIGAKEVTVQARQYDAKGNETGVKEITANRNAWDAKRLDTMREDAIEKLKEAANNTKQPLIKVFDRDAQRSTSRTVPEPERSRDSERARA